MKSKSEIKRLAMKNAARLWGVRFDQLDPIVRLLIETFAALNYDLANSVEDIKERLLSQIANALTPDNLIAAQPAHSLLKVMPVEPKLTLNKNNTFYTKYLTSKAIEYDFKTVNFSPVINNIKLVRGEIKSFVCERNLYSIGIDDEKDLLAKANAFFQDLNRTVYLGFDLDPAITDLKDIHFYFDFNLPYKHKLYELLHYTTWSINNKQIAVKFGLGGEQLSARKAAGIFSHYNTLNLNDEKIMDLYRNQFLHIDDSVRIKTFEKHSFPPELLPFFPDRVKDLDPQYWLKIVFPPYFKKEDLEDLQMHLNVFPVSNKSISKNSLRRGDTIAEVLPLTVGAGEYFLAVENVEDSFGLQYKFLPYSLSGYPLGGTYTIKKGGKERFSSRELKDLIERFIDLMREELVTYNKLKLDNISNSMAEIYRVVANIKEKVEHNNSQIKEVPTYLLIDSDEDNKHNDVEAAYWVTNCDIANDIPFRTQFEPLKNLPLEKDLCYLLKTASGGKAAPKESDHLIAYKYALTTRDQLFSDSDIETYCYMKYAEKVTSVRVAKGVAVSSKPKEGLIRTIDVIITPANSYQELFNSENTLGELKLELEKRSPSMYNYRVLMQENKNTNHTK